ncbi:MAG: hypothetical protein N2319_03185 [Candidatus Kapabacteria bacterium]|nr:hypothetical protein [Candidatus Kapabacteria bacterium]
MLRKIKIFGFFSIFSFLLFICNSCNEKPTDLGFTLLYDTITVVGTTSTEQNLITNGETILNRESLFNIGAIFVGKSDSLKAITFLRFSRPADSLKNYRIDSVSLTLFPLRYAFGDTINGNFSFKIKAVTQFWSNKTTWDSIFDAAGNTAYFDAKILGTYNQRLKLRDTMPDIRIKLDPSVISDWLNFKPDTVDPWGLALIPDDNSSIINLFSSQMVTETRLRPVLRIYFSNGSGKTDSIAYLSNIESSYIDGDRPDPNSLTFQGGIIYYPKLKFDFSIIPKNSSVHKAELELWLNRGKSRFGNAYIDSILFAGDYRDRKIDSMPYRSIYGFRFQNSNRYLFPALAQLIESWVRGSGSGEIVISLDGLNAYRKLDRYTFYNINDQDSNLVPKIRVIYSIRPQLKK